MNAFSSRLLGLLLPLSVAAPASAQFYYQYRPTVQSRSASYYTTWGISRANLFLDVYGQTQRSYDTVNGLSVPNTRATGRIRAGATVLGYSAEAGAVETSAWSNYQTKGGNINVRLAGFTIYSASHSGASSISRNFGPYNLFNPAPTYSTTIVFVPVTASCNVGAAANADFIMTEDLFTLRSVYIGGTGSAFGTGTARVGAGISGFQAWLQLDLRFLQVAVSGDLIADPSRLEGSFWVSLTPLRALLKACVEIFWVDHCETIFDWSTAPISITRVLG
jgi:hypothetical protein